MYHRPKFDLGTALVVICILIGALVSGTILGGCTTAKAPTYSTTHTVEHDSRTRTEEPKPSHIR
jgi:hypothetical protein